MIYTCIDSFSGAGGLSLGLQKAGFDVLCSFDNDPNCVKTQRANKKYFDHKILQAGIDDLLKGALLKKAGLKRGELFLLAGGPPCQGFSIQRIGDDNDVRNNLVQKFVRLIDELLPQYFLMENVPGIKGARGSAILDRALNQAAKIGYHIHENTLDAQDYGVPQRRKRVIIVGERMNGRSPAFRIPMPVTLEGGRKTVYETIGHLPAPPEDGSNHPRIPNHRRDRLSELNKKRLAALKAGQGRDQLPRNLLADCHLVSSSIIGHRNVYGRMSWDEVAPTITARFDSFTRGQFGHPDQLRSISLHEGALLQTFPEDFIFIGNKVEIARQIGNAVPVQLAVAIGRQIIRCHREKLAGRDRPKNELCATR
jgi:DNA (cytosine-5)-methyltransferase 1